MFSNKLDDLINDSDKEHFISHRQNKNVTSPRLLVIKRNRGTDNFEWEEKMKDTKKTRLISVFFIEE